MKYLQLKWGSCPEMPLKISLFSKPRSSGSPLLLCVKVSKDQNYPDEFFNHSLLLKSIKSNNVALIPAQLELSQFQGAQVVPEFKLQRISADFWRILRSSERSFSTRARWGLRFSLSFFNWEIWSWDKWDKKIIQIFDYLIGHEERKFVAACEDFIDYVKIVGVLISTRLIVKRGKKDWEKSSKFSARMRVCEKEMNLSFLVFPNYLEKDMLGLLC